MATKSTRKHPSKAMRLKDLSSTGRKEIRGGVGAVGGTGSGKIKFND